MDNTRTNYEKWYSGEEYYWGTDPASFCNELISLAPLDRPVKVLDIGCGEGKDAVFMAKQGYDVTAFDITESGIRKTMKLAAENGVSIKAYTDDINTFEINDSFDIIYSTGTIQYLFDENIDSFFNKIDRMTTLHGFVYFNVFVEKPFIPLPPDWDIEEKMWRSGELFTHFKKWKIHRIDEIIFEDTSGGVPHLHFMDTILAEKMIANH